MPPKKKHPKSTNQNSTTTAQPGGAQQQQQPVGKGATAQIGFLPPGANAPMKAQGPPGYNGGNGSKSSHNNRKPRVPTFENEFEHHFTVPTRLHNQPCALVEAVNDFHFAMMNDTPRNEFYYNLLKKHIVPGESGVVEIGAGSGVLSMMAAQLGAKWVVAVEGSAEMAQLARNNIKENGFEKTITVLNLLSTDLQAKDLPGTPDVMVSEIFGTLLLGESALDYIADMRKRLLPKGTPIIPRYGTQFAVLVECPTLDSICHVESWNGLKLHNVNALKDTASCVFTKKYGFRMNSVPFKELSEPIEVAPIDFMQDEVGLIDLQRVLETKIIATGTAHAMLLYWKAFEGDQMMSTDPRDTVNNFPRDMQWGQALQLLEEDPEGGKPPLPVKVVEGSSRHVKVVTSEDNVVCQFEVLPARPMKVADEKKE